MGYHQAGFNVLGVDIEPQPNYPFTFVQADALAFVAEHGREYDAIHASPPCQAYSPLIYMNASRGTAGNYKDLIAETRQALIAADKPYVIENVPTAPIQGIKLCGTMFGLMLFRHRLFESNILLLQPGHVKHRQQGLKAPNIGSRPRLAKGEVFQLIGNYTRSKEARAHLNIAWMTKAESAQAIPPAYTEFIGRQLIKAVEKVST